MKYLHSLWHMQLDFQAKNIKGIRDFIFLSNENYKIFYCYYKIVVFDFRWFPQISNTFVILFDLFKYLPQAFFAQKYNPPANEINIIDQN